MGAMRLLLVAPPGAGKGTQADRLSAHFGIEHISTGDLLRQAVADGTPLGHAVKGYLERGDLVPDTVIFDMILDRVVAASAKGGYLLDGFPRTLEQAEQARRIALDLGVAVQAAIYLEVSHDESIRRLLGRAGQQGRADDNEATILHRLEVFEKETLPLVAFYQTRGLLMRIDGERPVDQVTADILDGLARLTA
jgi:adenylate kinase